MSKIAVQIRLDEDTIKNVDEVAKVLGMSRSKYCAYVVGSLHSDELNPMTIANRLVEENGMKAGFHE